MRRRYLFTCLLLVAAHVAQARDGFDLGDFATRYAAAWSGQDAAALANFYAESGSLRVNDAFLEMIRASQKDIA